jgi:hypothetical protein
MCIPGDATAPEYNRQLFAALLEHGKALGGIPCRPESWAIDAGGTNFDPVIRFAGESARLCGIPAWGYTGRGWSKYRPWGKTLVEGQRREQCHGCLDQKEGRHIRWVAWNTDYWREVAQKAWLGEVGAPGAVSLFDGQHGEFANQIVAQPLLKKGVGLSGGTEWIFKPDNLCGRHDFGDAMAQGYAAAAFGGIGTGGRVEPKASTGPARVLVYRPSMGRR